jgi:hypothetical protein
MTTTTTPSLFTRRSRRFTSVAAALAVAAGVLVGSAATASAYTSTANLRVSGGRHVTVTGYLAMGQYETHGYLNNGARLNIALYGDDIGLTDDFLGSTGWITRASGTVGGATLYPSERGIEFEWVTSGTGGFWLNEDAIGNDEVYAYVTIVDGDGHLMLDRRTPIVTGDFGFNGR